MTSHDDTIQDSTAAVITVLREVMGIDDIDPNTDFYEVGGHSLLAVEAIARLRTEYGLSLPARQFLVNARVSAIAAACSVVEDPSDPN